MEESTLGFLYGKLMHGCGVVAATLYTCIAIIISVDVLLRNLTVSLNLPWALEGSEYLLGAATFIAAPWGLYVSAHVRIDVLLNMASHKAAQSLELLGSLIGAIVCVILFYFSVDVTITSASRGNMIVKTMVFPEWWQYTPVIFCFFLLSIEFLRRMMRAMQGKLDTPQEELF